MARVRVKVKMPSKSALKREMNKAIRKNLVCFKCGRNMPNGVGSIVRCPSCHAVIRLN